MSKIAIIFAIITIFSSLSILAMDQTPPPLRIDEGEDVALGSATLKFTATQTQIPIYVTVTPNGRGPLLESVRISFGAAEAVIPKEHLADLEYPDLFNMRAKYWVFPDGKQIINIYFSFRPRGCTIARGICRLVEFWWTVGNGIEKRVREVNVPFD